MNKKIQRQSEYANFCKNKKVGTGNSSLGWRNGLYLTNSTYDNTINQKPFAKLSEAFSPKIMNLSGGLSYGFWFADSRSLDIPDNTVLNWIEGQYSRRTYSLLADIKYHFINESKWMPYLGLQAGAVVSYYKDVHGKQMPSSIGGGALAGVKALLTENTSIFVEYNFLAFRRGSHRGDGDVNGDNYMDYQDGILFGLQCYW